jgi:hypothetical protein
MDDHLAPAAIKGAFEFLKPLWKYRFMTTVLRSLDEQGVFAERLIRRYSDLKNVFYALPPSSDVLRDPWQPRSWVKLSDCRTADEVAEKEQSDNARNQFIEYKDTLQDVARKFGWPSDTMSRLTATMNPRDGYSAHCGFLERIAAHRWWNFMGRVEAKRIERQKAGGLPPG